MTTNIVFDHRNRTKPGMEGPLEVRVVIDRHPYYISTGIKVRRSEWKQGIIVDRVNAPELNERLGMIYRRIEAAINEAVAQNAPIDVAVLKRRALAAEVESKENGLIDWLRDQISMLTHEHGTMQHYYTLLTRLEAYGKMRCWADVTIEGVMKWDAWLHQLTKKQSAADRLAGLPPEPISEAAIYNYHKCMKALLNRALLFGKLMVNPYDRLKGQFKRGEHERIEYLTDAEMEAFEALHPLAGSKLAMARDLFVMQAYTGMSYSDIQAFDIANYKLVDGVWRNVGERIKTGVPYISQLLPPVLAVLEKYNMQVPKLDNADYNRCLKLLGEVAGIDRPLHSHMARHTFATWMLRQGVPIEHVSKMVGHTNIRQTQRYAKLLADDIHKDFDRVANLLKK